MNHKPNTMLDYKSLLSQTNPRIGQYDLVSQDPSALSPHFREYAGSTYLPIFLKFWHALEEVSGHRWKNTSYIRRSPSHQRGQAFDLAPDIAPSSEEHYAVTNNSDPVLYKRQTLIRQLQSLKDVPFGGTLCRLGVFIEPDHLHIQVLSYEDSDEVPTPIVKWKIAKPLYPDTYARMELPLM